MTLRGLFAPALILLLTACASGTYTPPPSPVVDIERVTGQPLADVWAAIVNGAPSLGYEVRDTNREAGIITLGFGEQDPAKYVECGDFSGSTGNTSFTGKWINWVTTSRQARLTGLMQVRLESLAERETRIAVRAGYALTLPASIAPGFAGADFSFATDSTDTVAVLNLLSGGQPNRTCGPSGVAERERLDLV